MIYEINTQGKIVFANNRAYNFFGVTDDDYQTGVYAVDYVIAADRPRLAQNMQHLLQGESVDPSEFSVQKKDGTVIPVLIHSTLIIRNGKAVGFSGIIIDITERKRMENRIITLNERDALTGLYNRLSFENKMQQLAECQEPISIIVCDIDGLKLANDTMGHSCGDQLIVATARTLKEIFSSDAFIARIGGDEFAIILINTPEKRVEEQIQNLQIMIIRLNQNAVEKIPLSLSCGYATSKTSSTDPEQILREADHHMYKEKLFHSQSNRNTVIQTLLKSLKMRDYIIDGHVERLQELVLQLATRAGIATQRLDDLHLFAQFHDIGKVSVPERILFKQDPFTKEERMEMQRHSEIGYRIAQSAPDLVHISDWILKHHEWWNGSGYPLGLKGTEIPLECRILSIIDAFDAMTHDRPYRKAITPIQAIAEIQRYSDIQFDPWLVGEFVQMIKQPVSDKLFSNSIDSQQEN